MAEEEEYKPTNIHKYLCRGKDTMTIYSLLAIYTWVLIEGNFFQKILMVRIGDACAYCFEVAFVEGRVNDVGG